jgi:hypothetical protein
MYPAASDPHEHVSRSREQAVKDDLPVEAVLVERDAPVDIGCEYVDMVKRVNHRASFFVKRASECRENIFGLVFITDSAQCLSR